MARPKETLTPYGIRKVNEHGQITVPEEARAQLGIEAHGQVVVFGDQTRGRLIVLPWDPPGDELMEFATKHAPRPAKT